MLHRIPCKGCEINQKQETESKCLVNTDPEMLQWKLTKINMKIRIPQVCSPIFYLLNVKETFSSKNLVMWKQFTHTTTDKLLVIPRQWALPGTSAYILKGINLLPLFEGVQSLSSHRLSPDNFWSDLLFTFFCMFHQNLWKDSTKHLRSSTPKDVQWTSF
jgi:hypothetical protein